MKIHNVFVIIVLLLVGIIGGGIETNASSAATVSKQQETWFVAGYLFDVANTAEHIALLRVLLGSAVDADTLEQLKGWELSTLTKEEARAVLLTYLRGQDDLDYLEAFCMGEWVSNIEDSVANLKNALENRDDRLVFESTVTAYALACQAAGFIDVLGATAPLEILQALAQIEDKAQDMDIAGLIIRDVDVSKSVGAIVDLLDLCKLIKDTYGIGNL